ncbi:Ig-like domain-containing protein [Adhaeribacter swui]|uniref:Ig-like domain-containing protein n=1 Tax=Adhaeribacter swui TaxID=2086471 RepID=A0A7G7GEB8_9BACT|nr:Ig-like domain-containing protein [Adhaeribacter swui]QNF35502.1 Ig-like domain-containing protein [Adhaeribacter swui]
MKKTFTVAVALTKVVRAKWGVVVGLAFLTCLQVYFPGYSFRSNIKKKVYNPLTFDEQAQVISFNLINANSDQPILNLTDGAVLNLATLPTRKLNIQAVTNPENVGSVVLQLSGRVNRKKKENAAPYALYSENKGNYLAWTPPVGNYTLIATPYSGSNGTGISGTPLSINFSVINKAQYTLTIHATEAGIVGKSPDQATYNKGDAVSLTAIPAPGYQFNGWSGHASGRVNPLNLTINGNKSIQANFGPQQPEGSVITYLSTQSDRPYALSILEEGTNLYTDRPYLATSVPDFLRGATFIKTPNDDKANRLGEVVSFELTKAATVYVAYDPVALILPKWLQSWEKMTEGIGINDPRIDHLVLYRKYFPAGLVKIGGNLARPALGSKNTYVVVVQPPITLRPFVTEVRPANGAVNVPLDQSISVDLKYPSGRSIDGTTVNSNTVKLYTIAPDNQRIPVEGTAVNSTAGGDAITLSATLKPSTTYEFLITDGVQDGYANPIVPFTSRFTTTTVVGEVPTDLAGISFTEQTLIDNSFGQDGFTTLVIGPDHRLYAATSGGKIERWDINPDGSITNHVTMAPFEPTRRLLIGFRFDPGATAGNLVAWISHSSGAFNNVNDWTGKISKINLNDPAQPLVTDYVINLPRSYKDHSTNSLDFGPDGALYFPQGSHSAMGLPDAAWGYRPERLLTAAILRLDIGLAQQQALPIDVKTQDGGSYNPYAYNAPLKIYATGVRNAYDLVWHSNGQLYVPTNGSAAGGNTLPLKSGTIWSNGQPYTGPDIAAMSDVRDTQNDYLFRVVAGGYYGHPNPLRNEYILNGGNPTAGVDPGEITWTLNGQTYGYPVGTPVEPNYRGWAYDFGGNISPNGIIEFKSNAFYGKLKGKLLVCRFSGGDDIMVLEPGIYTGDIIQATEGIKIPGLRRPFANPLDIIEDVQSGNLYISEYYDGNGDGKPRITLLKANIPATATAARFNAAPATTVAPETSLAVFPNPNDGNQITVSIKGFAAQEQVTLTLHDATGLEVEKLKITTDQQGNAQTEIAKGKRLKAGLYLVNATAGSDKQQAKLLVK